MNVVRLFPDAAGSDEGPPISTETPSRGGVNGRPAPSADRVRRPALRTPSPVEILARSVGGTQTQSLSPEAIIAQALDRSPVPENFWSVWMVHQGALRQRSLRLSGGNRADAEDALGATMVRAAQAYGRQAVQNPGAWLVRILHNTCMDQHRHNASRMPIETDDGELPQPSVAAWTKTEPSPEEAVSQQEADAAWRRAMNALPAALVEPLRLHLDDWSDEDIATHLGISRELVRKRRQLAKNRLRLLLDL